MERYAESNEQLTRANDRLVDALRQVEDDFAQAKQEDEDRSRWVPRSAAIEDTDLRSAITAVNEVVEEAARSGGTHIQPVIVRKKKERRSGGYEPWSILVWWWVKPEQQ